MKKYLALILAVLMVVAAFAGCTDAKDDGTAGNNTPGGTTPGGTTPGGTTPGGTTPGGTTPGGNDKPATGDDVPVNEEPYGTFRTYFTNPPPTVSCLATQDTNPWTLIDLTSISLYRQILNDTKDGWVWDTDLAADMPKQVDADGYVWEYTIIKDAKWSNGEAITVDDLEFTFKEHANPKMQYVSAAQMTSNAYGVLKNIYEYQMGTVTDWAEVGYTKIDDYTFRAEFTTVATLDDALRACNRSLVNETIYTKGMNADGTGTVYGTSVENYVSAGEFILTEWIPDAKYVLTRNPDYVHADEIKIQEIVYTCVPDTNTALQLFEKGELDYCSLSYTQWEQFEEDPRVYEYFGDSLMYLMVNHGNPSFGNVLGNLDFRKALFYGADRVEIAKTLGAYPATRLVRRAVIANPVTGLPFYQVPQDYIEDGTTVFNKDKANQLLNKAYEACGQTKVDMRILYSETSTHLRGAAELLQKQYHDVFAGKLNVIMHALPSAQAQQLRKWDPDNPTSFDTAFGSFLPSANDPRQTFKFYTSDYTAIPRFKWTSDRLDELYKQSNTLDLEGENDKVLEMCHQMEKLLLDEMVIIPVYEIPTKVVYSDKITLPAGGYVIGFGFGNTWMTIEK